MAFYSLAGICYYHFVPLVSQFAPIIIKYVHLTFVLPILLEWFLVVALN